MRRHVTPTQQAPPAAPPAPPELTALLRETVAPAGVPVAQLKAGATGETTVRTLFVVRVNPDWPYGLYLYVPKTTTPHLSVAAQQLERVVHVGAAKALAASDDMELEAANLARGLAGQGAWPDFAASYAAQVVECLRGR